MELTAEPMELYQQAIVGPRPGDGRHRIDTAVAAVMAMHRAAELADQAPAIYA